MAFGKTPEQKAADEQKKADRMAKGEQQMLAHRQQLVRDDAAKEAKRAAENDIRGKKEFPTTPIGQATTAKEQRQGFFEIQLEVGSSQRDSTILGGNNFAYDTTRTQSHAGTLAAIESVGWHLEHVGHVFVVTSESSRDKFLASGQQVAVSGHTLGIYLFRNVE